MLSWTPERWQKASSILDEALERPAGERRAFVEAQCDDALRDEILAMLALEASDHTLLDQGALEAAAPLVDEAETDLGGMSEASTVGRYRLNERLGRGGMGIVYLAERADGQYQQNVALKLLTRASGEAVQRFKTERQILAALDHPNVARLLDGGTTEPTPSQPEGVPFLVMEHVDGVPITDYCVANQLSVEARLELMIEVAEAVQHAHRKLVIHRDLKPSNILVTETDDGTPQVKLLDFGIAKMLDDGALSAEMDPVSTQTGLALLTPAYAAPEQVAGQPCDATTDVYQLGVVLYEMLTGHLPFDLGEASPSEAAQVILEEEPQAPSEAVAGVAAGVATQQGTNAPTPFQLRGDLDPIVMTALRKEPDRRYASSADVQKDLERYLADRPITARPTTTGYRVRKFIQRNRIPATIGAVVAVLLSVAVAVILYQGQVAERERDRAQTEAEKAQQVTAFLTSILTAESPETPDEDAVTLRDVLDRGASRVDSLVDRPEVQFTLYKTTGDMYRQLGDMERADSLLARAVDVYENHPDLLPDHEKVEVLTAAALLKENTLKSQDAEDLYKEALNIERALHDDEHVHILDLLIELGGVYSSRSRWSKGETTLKQALEMYDWMDPETAGTTRDSLDGSYAIALHDLALLYHRTGRYAEAKPLYDRSIQTLENAFGPSFRNVHVLKANRSGFYKSIGWLAESEAGYRDAIAGIESVYGADHAYSGRLRIGFSITLRKRGQFVEVDSLLRAQTAHWVGIFGPESGSVRQATVFRGLVAADAGWYAKADSLFQRAHVLANPERNPSFACHLLHDNQGYLALRQQRWERAVEQFTEAAACATAFRDRGKEITSLHQLARALSKSGDPVAADTALARAARLVDTSSLRHTAILIDQAATARHLQRYGDADEFLHRAQQEIAERLPPNTDFEAAWYEERSRLHRAQGEWEAAQLAAQEALQWYQDNVLPNQPDRVTYEAYVRDVQQAMTDAQSVR